MKFDRYELKTNRSVTTFEFLSEGIKGKVVKVIQFQQLKPDNFYNLAFGDKNTNTGRFDDSVATGNGDSEKVLATVVAAVYTFSRHHPGAWIYATGSTKASTRLYRMGINKYFEIAQREFELMGKLQNAWEQYEKGKDYDAFAAKRKD